jgi:hypothetical protein
MTLICVHSVKVTDQPKTGTSGVVRQARRHGPFITYTSLLGHSPPASQAGHRVGPALYSLLPRWLTLPLMHTYFEGEEDGGGGRGVRHNSPLSGFLFLPTSDQIPMGPAIGRETKHRGWASHAVGLCITDCGGPTVQYKYMNIKGNRSGQNTSADQRKKQK